MTGLAIACPGQGAQHPAMFELALQSPPACAWLEAYSGALGYDIVALAREGDDLFANRHAQPLVCGAAVATWVALQAQLDAPDLFLGYSVGELAAYGCAGAWDARQLAMLVTRRAALMDQAAPADAGMLAVKGMTPAAIRALCAMHALDIAIVNGDDHVVLGGGRIGLEGAVAEIDRQGHWCRLLEVAVPSHTPALQAAVAPMRALFAATPTHPLSATVLAGIDGMPVDAATLASSLAAQIAQSVRWIDCMQTAQERGVEVVLELGPGRALSRMFEEFSPHIAVRACDDFRTVEGIVKWVRSRHVQ